MSISEGQHLDVLEFKPERPDSGGLDMSIGGTVNIWGKDAEVATGRQEPWQLKRRKIIFSHLVSSPPQSVHCIPYSLSKLSVTKKLRTEPRRETPRVRPKARPSS